MQFNNHNIFPKFQKADIKNKKLVTEADTEFCPGKIIELE